MFKGFLRGLGIVFVLTGLSFGITSATDSFTQLVTVSLGAVGLIGIGSLIYRLGSLPRRYRTSQRWQKNF